LAFKSALTIKIKLINKADHYKNHLLYRNLTMAPLRLLALVTMAHMLI
jgi:hypothetical protein